MIPVKLTIQGLYSYRTRQPIDFTNLTKSGLFGIFGGVGSGKSSILEAISFALYGEIERLNARDGRNYNMMNLKSNELLIDFEFKTHDDVIYRFVVQGKRNKKNFEDVKAFERTAYRFKNNKWDPISVDQVETITGLNYRNFRRTIIIPQGKFQEFLQLNSSDRTTMLKELFNLSKYELSDKISRLDSKNESTIQHISGRLQEIGEVDPEKIDLLEKQKAQLQKDIGKFKKELVNKEKKDQQAENLKKLVGVITEQKRQQAELQQSEAATKNLEKKVKEYELLSRIFKADISQLEELGKSYKSSDDELTSHKKSLGKLQQESETIQIVYDNLKKEYEKKDHLIRESEELLKYTEVKKTGEELNLLSKNAKNNKKELGEIADLVISGKKKQKDQTTELENLRKSLPDIKVLSGVKAWFTEKTRIRKSIVDLQKKIDEHDNLLAKLNIQAKVELTSSGLIETLPEHIDINYFLAKISLLGSTCEKKLRTIAVQISDLEIQHKLEQYAVELHEGKPCPLCGSETHPNILNPTEVASDLEKVRADKKIIEDQFKKCIELEKTLTANHIRQDSILQQNKELMTELIALQSTEQVHNKKFIWEDFENDNEDKVIEEETRYEKVKKSIEDGVNDLNKTGVEIDRNEKSLENNKTELVRTEQQITGAQTRKDILLAQIKLIDLQFYQNLSAEQLNNKSNELIRQHNDLSQKFTDTEKKVNSIKASVNALSGKISEMERNHKYLHEQLQKLNQQTKKKLKLNGDLELSYVLSVLKKEIDVDKEKSGLEEFYRSLEALKKYLNELEKELAGRIYEKDSHQLLKEEIKKHKHTIETMNQDIGRHETEIITLKSKVQDYALQKTELKKVELRKQDISELKILFRGSGFVNYVSTVYLQNLCKAANERFYKLTRQKLGLELAEDNSFEVRDYMNEGHLRSVKTLSGGQTFQASLSLALSLADSIHKLAGSSENFFFMDEGFGTLDKETLEVAFDTLKALRKENRIVGVISHVEEMQSEIETYLKVTNDEEHGSIVKNSWES
ncbi:MAG: SMC family ATPase [Bacteroidota bacterium]